MLRAPIGAKRYCRVVFVTLCFLAMPHLGTACTICIGMPEKTAADLLLKNHCVVRARQDADNPFAYSPLEILKGRYDHVEIDLLVDSLTRRRLSIDANCSVLLVQESERAGWRNLGVMSDEFESVVRRILLFASEWQGESGPQKRVEYFLSLFGSEDHSVHELAYLELGRAPYAVIRKLGERVQRSDIGPMLDRAQYLQWRSLAILLLGHSDNLADQQEVTDAFHTAERLRLKTNLAAWATAAIEVRQGAAVDFIADRYFSNPRRSPDELEAVIKAMSLHGAEGHTHLREKIIACYLRLVEVHPRTATRVAKDLSAWNRDDLAAPILHDQTDPLLTKTGTD